MSRPPLAIFTPLPPAKSGIADYASELAPLLAEHFDLVHVVEDRSEALDIEHGFEVIGLSDYLADEARDRATPRIYHQGNNPDHAFVYKQILQRPGVTVLHDFVLHHLLATMTLGQGDLAGYEDTMAYDHGRLGVEMARQRRRHVFSEYQQFLLPLNGRVLDGSLGLLVHSDHAAQRIREQRPDHPVRVVRHHLAPPPPGFTPDSKQAARERLGLPMDATVFTSLGHITPPKQIELALKAMSEARERLGEFVYVLAGERNASYDIDRHINNADLGDRVRVTGYLDLAQFHDHILASDAIINLRYPSAGETSGTLVRAMGLGRPAVVFDYGSFADYPHNTAMKLPLSAENPGPLADALVRLATDEDFRDRLGRNAAHHVKTEHAIGNSVEAYRRAYDEWLRPEHASASAPAAQHSTVAGNPALGLERASEAVRVCRAAITEQWAGDYFDSHAKRYERTFARIPTGDESMSLLELGSYVGLLDALQKTHGYGRVVGSDWDEAHKVGRMKDRAAPDGTTHEFYNFNVEAHRFPFPSRSFDVVLCCEVLEHLAMDPMFMLSEINRVLKFGGVLVLTTPNLVSARSLEKALMGYAPQLYLVYRRDRSTNRHNIEYTPRAVHVLAESAGFGPVRVETEDCWSDPSPAVMKLLQDHGYPTDQRGDNIFLIATKRAEMIDRYPAEIYDPGQRLILHAERSAIPGG
ncbi:MAG: glycosyltransferase [Phycisphaerales bacterium JB040]